MSRFYTSSKSERETVRNHGGRKTLEVHSRGWTMGVKVIIEVDENGCDHFSIYKTGGSEAPMKLTPITSFTDKTSAGPRNPKGQLKKQTN